MAAKSKKTGKTLNSSTDEYYNAWLGEDQWRDMGVTQEAMERAASEAGASVGDYSKAFASSVVRGFGDMEQGLVVEPLA